ncbi:hypothetical protein MLD38_002944 [Melastoma candidum]|uniref:Uncharacterized protein n=1 Tax=Melastoma candidum TaxID=119954 RepID=A0ACB9S5E4_9MYRT|nr:hypothetical protein MLD38_002944 [Melastoma candidum]
MPRSSRHKSSKHSARDSREYSESEDDFGVKERKGDNDDDGGSVRVSKESVLSEKSKLDSKEIRRDAYDVGSGNGDCGEDYRSSSSRRRKERGSSDGVNDRLNGGGECVDERGEGSKKARGSWDSKSGNSRWREDEVEEAKRSGGRSEKHSSRESSRKEGKDKERERDGERDRDRERDRYKEKDRERERERDSERKGKGGKGDKFGDNEDERSSSKREITTDDVLERRNWKRSENSTDIYQDETGDVKNKHSSFADGVVKEIRKDDKLRDEKYRDKYRDETEKSRQDKYKDEYPVKDRARSRSREKYSRDSKDHKDVNHKRTKLADGDEENESHSNYDHSRYRDQDQERDRGREYDGYRKCDQVDPDRDHDPLLEKERERDWDCDRERERDHVHDQEPDMVPYDERGSRSKDQRDRRLSPDDRNNYMDSKVKDGKGIKTDMDKAYLGSNKVEVESKGDKSYHPTYVDVRLSNNRGQVSPTSSSHGGDDGSRHVRHEDAKYRYLQMESQPKENSGRISERSSNYRSSEKYNKADDGHAELTGERSSSSKPSPMDLTDGSSSPSLDRRYMSRSGVRRNLDVKDAGRKSSASAGSRDFSGADGKSGRDVDVCKSMVEESSRADSSFNSRQGQGNMNPLPPFRHGVESPTFMGMMEEDSRLNSNTRYKRMADPGMGRGHMNSWRGVPNWSPSLPNGFMPFQSGPPHGNFQSIVPHFASPHIFGVRPPIEINQPCLPFPLANSDRVPGHLRPLGWPNIMDPSVPPRLHGWDVNNGVLRGESHFFGTDWEHNRHPVTAREWESNVGMWKGHNGISDAPSATSIDSSRAQFPIEDGFSKHGTLKSNNENCHEVSELKSAENRPVLPPEKESPILSSEFPIDRKQVSTKSAEIDSVLKLIRFYLSRLNISEQLVHPEVYKQCIDLLDGKPSLATAIDSRVHMILTSDRRKGLRDSDDSLSSSVLPCTDDYTFQKSLELYKSQRVEMRDIAMMKVDLLDSTLSTKSNDDMNQRGIPNENEEKPALKVDGEEPLLLSCTTSDLDKIIDDAYAAKDEPVDEPSLEPNNVALLELQAEVVQKLGVPNSNPGDHAETSNDILAETSNDIPQDTTAEVDANLGAANFEISSGRVGSDSVIVGCPSEACEAPNESELANHGRIHHHSPGSTQ